MIADARKKLDAEIRRLEVLYFLTIGLYRDEARAKFQESTRTSDQPIRLVARNWQGDIAENAEQYRAKVQVLLPKVLRETIFVRLLSALEVFFTDLVREAYALRRDLIGSDDHVEFSYRELSALKSISELFTRLVDKDCRRLTSGGFPRVERYLRQKLLIDITSLPNYKTIRELFDRRHILVHRLGVTDEQYRHDYSYTKKKVSVDEAFLLAASKAMREFSDALTDVVSKRISARAATERKGDIAELLLDIEISSQEAREHTEVDSFLLLNDRFFCVRDILVERQVTDYGAVLRVRGDRNVVTAYYRRIRRLQRQGKLKLRPPTLPEHD